MTAHQAPLSLGFSRQEHWSGLPYPSPRISQFFKDSIFLLLENGIRNENLVELIGTGVPLLLGYLSRKSLGTYMCLLMCVCISHVSIITSVIYPSVSVRIHKSRNRGTGWLKDLRWRWCPLYLVNVEPCGLFLSFLKNIFNWYAYELLSVIT